MDEQMESLPEIDYLSKDYASFRRLMLDHLSLRVPSWNEPSVADMGNVVIEVLAYAADYLSYYQDAVATEAYLGTARLRASIKRHVRLLDYTLHEGSNARVWVQVQVEKNATLLLRNATQLLATPDQPVTTPVIPPHSSAYEDALAQSSVFETLHNVNLFWAHNEIAFYVEDGEEVILPQHCTSTLLRDPGDEHKRQLQLQVGDVLIFEEVKHPETGERSGADPAHRHAVRLTAVTSQIKGSVPVLYVEWDENDELPFPLPISINHLGDIVSGISVARGNIVLADHGRTIRHEALPAVSIDRRYRPYLRNLDLTHHIPYIHEQALSRPACEVFAQDPLQATPAISLFTQGKTQPLSLEPDLVSELNRLTLSNTLYTALRASGVVLSQYVEISAVHGVGWEVHDILKKRHWLVMPGHDQLQITTYKKWNLRRDLLSSGSLASDYTVDMEDGGHARLRFGSGKQGRQPAVDDHFVSTYRSGRGTQGNVRADTINRIVTTDTRVIQVRNPLAALSGTNPQPIEDARFDAPYAFHTQQRCVTADDYAMMAEHHPQVKKAVAQLRLTGSRTTAFVYVQRHKRYTIDAAFRAELQHFLEDFRLPGYEIELRGPYFVALDIILHVYLDVHTAKSVVNDALTTAFSNMPGGFFAPENFTFGQSVYLSQVITRAMDVPGVVQVQAERFGRHDITTSEQPMTEYIPMGPLEIARLDNDYAAPHNGTILFSLEGGL